MKNLVIVESPSKAKTIQKYLGADFVVTSCMGHIRDLPENDKAIDVKNGFTPVYEISADKKKIVAELAKQARESDLVWLASDEDREGEAIAWHLSEALRLNPQKTRRIVFHEITRTAIVHAVKNPRSIDVNLVDAQQARRVLDRLVGYGLSPVLWKKVQRNLSAGRVQSVAVRLVVEREREIQAFTSTSSFKITADLVADGKSLTAELPQKFNTEEQAISFLERCKGASYSVAVLETKPAKKSPSAPFTTSTLQQEASRKLGYSLSRTMKLAQDLYEAGHITYMRTDSVNLSELALSEARSQINSQFGEKYSNPRNFTTKVASAQEAHEAIRPTDFSRKTAGSTEAHKKLYDLIWKRTLASQMSDARLERTIATIAISTAPETLAASGEVLVFDGFLSVYMESTDDEADGADNKMLPPLSVNQSLDFVSMLAQEKFQRPPARYTEASLVKKLEELGIGRPSTYAPTISTIQARKYVIKEDRDGRQREVRSAKLQADEIQRATATETTGAERSKLFPTDIGNVVTDFLVKNFDDILDYNFTAIVEKQFDEIAEGKLKWNTMIADFYGPFERDIKKTSDTAERQSGERLLGKDARTGRNVYVRLARYGPIAQIGDADDEDKQQKGLPGNMSIETITLEEAMELFKFPRIVGDLEGKPMVVKIGRFGPYIDHDGTFASVPKDEDPRTITAGRSIELIEARRKLVAERTIKEFPENPDVRILKGRWGPFLKIGTKNIRIPKDVDASALTLEECLALGNIAAQPAKQATKGRKKSLVNNSSAAANGKHKKAARKKPK